jgi:GNAT superfamily N-acetyltransferase
MCFAGFDNRTQTEGTSMLLPASQVAPTPAAPTPVPRHHPVDLPHDLPDDLGLGRPAPGPVALPEGGSPVTSGPGLLHRPAGRRREVGTARGTVLLRPASPLDARGVDRLVRGLSTTSSVRRFHSPVRALTPRQLAGIVDVDHRDRETLLALDRREVIGMAQFIAVPSGSRAVEVALVVADRWQRAGLGRILLAEVLAAAAAGGHTMATALVQADNRPMLELIRTAGLPVTHHRSGTTVELLIDLLVDPAA